MLGHWLHLQALEGNIAAAFLAFAVFAGFNQLQRAINAGQVGRVQRRQRGIDFAGLVAQARAFVLRNAASVIDGGRQVLAVLRHLRLQVTAALQQQFF
jgi:hypothetical protein